MTRNILLVNLSFLLNSNELKLSLPDITLMMLVGHYFKNSALRRSLRNVFLQLKSMPLLLSIPK